MPPATDSEVKGAWFVSMRTWLLDAHGEPALQKVLADMAPQHRGALSDPLASAWYPETALEDGLGAVFREIAGRDRAHFVAALERCTEIGVSRFFRALLRLASPGFVVRQIPTMWRHIRRGRGEVSIEEDGAEHRIAYRDFPYFANPHYEDLTLASVGTLLRITTGRAPQLLVEARSSHHLVLRVRTTKP